jgi:hypothetical protein
MKLNVATGVFEGLNDHEGIMLCGYEWGDDGTEETFDIPSKHSLNLPNISTFASKVQHYGHIANKWPYDNRIISWFKLWGHELNRNTPGPFEKTIIQTNWCNTEGRYIEGNYWTKLLADDQIENFIYHIEYFKPRLLFFFGSEIIKILQHEKVLPRFIAIMGNITKPLLFKQDSSFSGRRFKIGFQSFKKCNVIALPHPSGSRGLSDEYIKSFAADIAFSIEDVKRLKGLL